MGPAVSEAGIVSTLANVLIGGIYMSSSNGSINLSYDGDYAKYRAARAIVSSITGTMAEKISHAADEKRKEKEKSSAEKRRGEIWALKFNLKKRKHCMSNIGKVTQSMM